MRNRQTMQDQATESPPAHRWRVVEQLQPGMILARPIVVAENDVLVMKLAEGSELTESSIAQMYARGVECAAIVVGDAADGEAPVDIAEDAYRERLQAIFDCDDAIFLGDDCRPLFEALCRLGPPR